MKLGPGVDTTLPFFHVDDGLILQRQPNGDMRVMVTNGEPPLPTGANLKADVTVLADVWRSAMSAVNDALSSERGAARRKV